MTELMILGASSGVVRKVKGERNQDNGCGEDSGL